MKAERMTTAGIAAHLDQMTKTGLFKELPPAAQAVFVEAISRLREYSESNQHPPAQAQVPSDSDLIDWIGRQCLDELSMGIVIDAGHDGEYYVNGDDNHTYYGKTFREALTAALKGSK